jgi:hypothetical protein
LVADSEVDTTDPQNSHGGDQLLVIGNNENSRGMLKFSMASEIFQPNVLITSAVLRFMVSSNDGDSTTISVSATGDEWEEYTVTYDIAQSLNEGTVAGVVDVPSGTYNTELIVDIAKGMQTYLTTTQTSKTYFSLVLRKGAGGVVSVYSKEGAAVIQDVTPASLTVSAIIQATPTPTPTPTAETPSPSPEVSPTPTEVIPPLDTTPAPSSAAPSVAPTTSEPTVLAPSSAAPSVGPPTVAPPTVEPPITPSTTAPSVAPPTTEPTVAPPTIEPPTVAPPTDGPPTVGPPTVEPPTDAPPTVAPPTIQPPTVAPPTIAPPTTEPTVAPPTVAPPTIEPPTVAPPTIEPPTVAPPTIAPPTLPPGITPFPILIPSGFLIPPTVDTFVTSPGAGKRSAACPPCEVSHGGDNIIRVSSSATVTNFGLWSFSPSLYIPAGATINSALFVLVPYLPIGNGGTVSVYFLANNEINWSDTTIGDDLPLSQFLNGPTRLVGNGLQQVVTDDVRNAYDAQGTAQYLATIQGGSAVESGYEFYAKENPTTNCWLVVNYTLGPTVAPPDTTAAPSTAAPETLLPTTLAPTISPPDTTSSPTLTPAPPGITTLTPTNTPSPGTTLASTPTNPPPGITTTLSPTNSPGTTITPTLTNAPGITTTVAPTLAPGTTASPPTIAPPPGTTVATTPTNAPGTTIAPTNAPPPGTTITPSMTTSAPTVGPPGAPTTAAPTPTAAPPGTTASPPPVTTAAPPTSGPTPTAAPPGTTLPPPGTTAAPPPGTTATPAPTSPPPGTTAAPPVTTSPPATTSAPTTTVAPSVQILSPLKSGFVYSGTPSSPSWSDSNYLFTGTSSNFLTLMTFDVTPLPGFASVDQAFIHFYGSYRCPADNCPYFIPPVNVNFVVRPLLGSWSESSLRWSNKPGFSDEFSATSSFTFQQVGASGNFFYSISIDVTNLLNSRYLSQSVTLFDIQIEGPGSDSFDNIAILKSTNGPKLYMSYTPHTNFLPTNNIADDSDEPQSYFIPQALSTKIFPTQDAYVDGTEPNTVQTDNERLRIGGGGLGSYAYVDFDVTGVDQSYTTVYLEMNYGPIDSGGPFSCIAYIVQESWSKDTITYNNAPNIYASEQSVAFVLDFAGFRHNAFDITSLANYLATDPNPNRFSLKVDCSSEGIYDYVAVTSKRKGLPYSWYLNYDYTPAPETPPTTPTPAPTTPEPTTPVPTTATPAPTSSIIDAFVPTGMIVAPPGSDTFLMSDMTAKRDSTCTGCFESHGGEETIRVTQGDFFVDFGLFSFPLDDVPSGVQIINATVFLMPYQKIGNGGTVSLYRLLNANWNEESNGATSHFTTFKTNSHLSGTGFIVDVTTDVRNMLDADETSAQYMAAVETLTVSETGWELYSRENAAGRCYLVINYESSPPTPTPTPTPSPTPTPNDAVIIVPDKAAFVAWQQNDYTWGQYAPDYLFYSDSSRTSTFVTFDLSGVPRSGNPTVTLSMQVVYKCDTEGCPISPYNGQVTIEPVQDAWSENSITFANQPSTRDDIYSIDVPITYQGTSPYGNFYYAVNLDFSDIINNNYQTEDNFDFRIVGDTSSSVSDFTILKDSLKLTFDYGTNPVLPSTNEPARDVGILNLGGANFALYPADDTYVDPEAPSIQHGASEQAISGFNRYALVHFDLNGNNPTSFDLMELQLAFRLLDSSVTTDVNMNCDFYSVDDPFSESTTYNTRPSTSSVDYVSAVLTASGDSHWRSIEVDVTTLMYGLQFTSHPNDAYFAINCNNDPPYDIAFLTRQTGPDNSWRMLFTIATTTSFRRMLPRSLKQAAPSPTVATPVTVCKQIRNDTIALTDYNLMLTSIQMVIYNSSLQYAHVAVAIVSVFLTGGMMALFNLAALVKSFNFRGVDTLILPAALALVGYVRRKADFKKLPVIGKFFKKKNNLPIIASPYTAELTRLPTTLLSTRLLMDMLVPYVSHPSDIVKVSIVYNMDKISQFYKKYEEAESNYDHFELVERRLKEAKDETKVRDTIWFSRYQGKFYFRREVEAVEYYAQLMGKYKNKIDRWNECFASAIHGPNLLEMSSPPTAKNYPIVGTGFAYVIFRSSEIRDAFLKQMKHRSHNKLPTTISKPTALVPPPSVDITNGSFEINIAPTETLADYPRIRARACTYETQDIVWQNLFHYKKRYPWQYSCSEISILAFLALLILFVAIPLIVISSVQDVIEIPSSFLNNVNYWNGYLITFVFAYCPTLLLFVIWLMVPKLIIAYTRATPHKTHSRMHRLILKRTFAFLVLSTLIIPIIALGIIDGVVKYNIQLTRNWGEIFTLLFMPTSCAFFVNFVLHKAILKNALDLYHFGALSRYMWITLISPFIKYPFDKRMRQITPIRRLDAAESVDLHIETEYAYMLTVMLISICFALSSPMILVAAIGYFLIKFVIDRVTFSVMYAHHSAQRKRLSLKDAGYVHQKDFLAHRKLSQLVNKLVLVNLLLYSLYSLISFAPRISIGVLFIPHVAILFVLFLIVLFGLLLYNRLCDTRFNSPKTLESMNAFKPSMKICANLYELKFTGDDVEAACYGPKPEGYVSPETEDESTDAKAQDEDYNVYEEGEGDNQFVIYDENPEQRNIGDQFVIEPYKPEDEEIKITEEKEQPINDGIVRMRRDNKDL